jgi:hypothetical protein
LNIFFQSIALSTKTRKLTFGNKSTQRKNPYDLGAFQRIWDYCFQMMQKIESRPFYWILDVSKINHLEIMDKAETPILIRNFTSIITIAAFY